MMRTLFVKEIREALAGRRFWVILALCLVLIPLGVEVSLKDYQTRLQDYRESVRISQESVKGAGGAFDRGTRTSAGQGKSIGDILYNGGAAAFAPPSPLSFISLGLEPLLPNIAETQTGRVEPPVTMRLSNNQGRDNLYEFFYGPLDLVFIVAVVMSFLAVILTYGAVAGEKEQGTLRQVLSNSVPRPGILLAKAAANALVLVLPFLLALVLSLALVQLRGGPFGSIDGAWTSIALAVLVCLLFIGVFFNLGLLVSSLTKQAVPALVALLLAWVFLYGVYPRLGSAAAQILFPVKSEARVALEKAQVRRSIEKEQDGEIDKIAAAMPEDNKSEAFKEGEKKQNDVRDHYRARLEESWRLLERDVEERRAWRNSLTADITRLSPVSALVRSLAELSRTGWLEAEEFRAGVRRYEDALNRDVFGKYSEVRMKNTAMISNNADDKAPAPVFSYVRTREETIVRNVLPDIVLLLVFNFVFFAGGFVAFLRYDVR
jgi:ABC-type transport system involved in multi-copper enzyme maturation permease subunit